MLLCVLRDRTAWVKCCFVASETVQRELNVALWPQRPHSLSSVLLYVLRDRTAWVQCCLISSETVQLEFNVAWCPQRPHSSSSVLLDVLRDRTDYQRRGTQDNHRDFHTSPELSIPVQLDFLSLNVLPVPKRHADFTTFDLQSSCAVRGWRDSAVP